MNARQGAKFNMYRAVEYSCEQNAAVIAAAPAFETAFLEFKAKIVEISQTTQQKSKSLTGVRRDKIKLKQTVCNKADEIARLLYVYAVNSKNYQLKAEMDVSAYKLMRLNEIVLGSRCQHVYNRAAQNLANLSDYGITSQSLNELQTAIENYENSVSKPRLAISIRKTLVSNLRQLFKEADEILRERMDKLIVVFKAQNPDFVRTYKFSRTIVDEPTTTTQLKGIVVNKSDQTPIKNAAITIAELAKTVSTDEKGIYKFKPLPHGAYTVRVSAENFTDFETEELEVKMGKINRLNIELRNK